MKSNLILVKTPKEAGAEIAANAGKRRKQLKLTQAELASRSGVSLGSVKRFEQTGEISLTSLLKIALVLDCLRDFSDLFVKKEYKSIQEVIDEQNR